MRCGYHPTMCSPKFYAPLAKAAEAAGFDTFTLPDSICYPEHADSKYPYNDDGSREFLDGVPFIDPLIDNRFVFGIGLSPWEEDFHATGTDFHSRGKRMEQIIEIIRGLSTGEYFGYESEYYSIPRIKLCPVPSQPVRILYGGPQ